MEVVLAHGWLVDANDNRASLAYFGSEEAARAALATLVDCRHCKNCFNYTGRRRETGEYKPSSLN